MTDRGVSTVLDVAICLLLIGASVAILSTASPPPDRTGPDATAVAVVVASTTPNESASTPLLPGGTIAEQLAAAAIIDAGSQRLQPRVTQTRDRINDTLNLLVGHTHLTAVWRPFPNASIQGRVSVGESPPPTATVNAVRFWVPLGATNAPRSQLDKAKSDGFDAVATAVAIATLHRLRTPCDGIGSVRTAACSGQTVSTLNSTTVKALTDRFNTALRNQYSTPTAAVQAFQVDRVLVIVRRWER